MGNVDIVRKVLKKRMAVRGPDSGPGSLMWFVMFGYTLYNAFRLYQHGHLESQLDSFQSFKQLQKARQKITYTKFLFYLKNSDCFCEESMKKFFPGLKELINHGNPNATSGSTASSTEQVLEGRVVFQGLDARVGSSYNRIELCLQPNTPEYSLRLDTSKPHTSVSMPKGAKQVRCVLCCEWCIKNTCQQMRMGRKSIKYCFTCKVILCKHCHDPFHTQHVPLPSCSKNHGLGLSNITRSSVVTPVAAMRSLHISRSRSAPPAARRAPPPATKAARCAESANINSPPRQPRRKKSRGDGVSFNPTKSGSFNPIGP